LELLGLGSSAVFGYPPPSPTTTHTFGSGTLMSYLREFLAVWLGASYSAFRVSSLELLGARALITLGGLPTLART